MFQTFLSRKNEKFSNKKKVRYKSSSSKLHVRLLKVQGSYSQSNKEKRLLSGEKALKEELTKGYTCEWKKNVLLLQIIFYKSLSPFIIVGLRRMLMRKNMIYAEFNRMLLLILFMGL